MARAMQVPPCGPAIRRLRLASPERRTVGGRDALPNRARAGRGDRDRCRSLRGCGLAELTALSPNGRKTSGDPSDLSRTLPTDAMQATSLHARSSRASSRRVRCNLSPGGRSRFRSPRPPAGWTRMWICCRAGAPARHLLAFATLVRMCSRAHDAARCGMRGWNDDGRISGCDDPRQRVHSALRGRFSLCRSTTRRPMSWSSTASLANAVASLDFGGDRSGDARSPASSSRWSDPARPRSRCSPAASRRRVTTRPGRNPDRMSTRR